MRILVTGDTGLLGPYLKLAFAKLDEVTGVSSGECDLTNEEGVKIFLDTVKPRMIVHAAAMTDVDRCEKEPQLAVLNNLGMTENLIRFMPLDCRFVYISTDQVYSGHGPHRERSKSENPINMYGISKLMGEYAAARTPNHLIIRTTFFGLARGARSKSSLVDFLIGALKKDEPFNVFTDTLFNPLWAKTLADILVLLVKSNKVGTYNLGARDGMSRAKFAMLLADGLGLSAKGMRPVASATLPGRVPRPLDTRMDTTRIGIALDADLPSVDEDIAAMCRDIRCTN